jgi:hypothetical protein
MEIVQHGYGNTAGTWTYSRDKDIDIGVIMDSDMDVDLDKDIVKCYQFIIYLNIFQKFRFSET